MSVEEFLTQLDRDLEELLLPETAGGLTDILDELIPELVVLCQNAWLLELILDICNQRKERPKRARR